VLRCIRGTTLTGNHGTFETNRRSTTAGTLFRLRRGGISDMLAPSSLLRTGIGAGLILAATLLGWAATRRRQQAPRTEA